MEETCPQCRAQFPADAAWANRDGMLAFLYPAIAGLNTRVRCPRCGCIFTAEEIRYFGLLTPRGMKIVVGIILGTVVLGSTYLLFIETMFK
jgi:hypothetical protein